MSKIEVRVTHHVSHANVHNAIPGATVRNFVPGSVWQVTEAMIAGNTMLQMCIQRGFLQVVKGELSRDLCVMLGIPTSTAVAQAAAKVEPVVEVVAPEPVVEPEPIVEAVAEVVAEVTEAEAVAEEPVAAVKVDAKKSRKGKAQ